MIEWGFEVVGGMGCGGRERDIGGIWGKVL